MFFFYWSLNEIKSLQFFRNLFSIVADLNNFVVCMISIPSLISNSSNLCSKPFGALPNEPTANGISITLMFEFFGKVQVFFYLFTFLYFHSVVRRNGKIHKTASSFLVNTRSSRLAEIRWCVCIVKSQKSLCISFSEIDSSLCIYHLVAWSNFNLLYNFKWILLLCKSFAFPY